MDINMKICLVNKFHYIKGGSETYYFGLANLLRERGHEIIFFSMKDKKNVPCKQEKYFVDHIDFNRKMNLVKLIKTSLKMLYSIEARKKFEQLVLEERPDIIHLNIFQSQLTGSIVEVAKKYHLPVIYTAHDLKSICPNYQMLNRGKVCEKCLHGQYINCFRSGCMKNSKAKSLLASMESIVYKERNIYKKIDLVITPSVFYKKKIEESEVFDCEIVHIPNFLPEGTIYKNIRKGGDYFLYFGRLSKEKGLHILIKGYVKSGATKPLYIVGTGPEEDAVRKYITKYALNDKIKLLGFKSGDELRGLIGNAVCVCLLSTWYENGPYSIMEAQALGRPVLVSTLGGLPELVIDKANGRINNPNTTKKVAELLKYCENKEDWDYEKIVDFAANKYNPAAYADKITSLYSRFI